LANDLNDLGQVVGGAENSEPDTWNFAGITLELPSPTSWHAFLWQAGVMKDLGTLGGPDSFALTVNAIGQAAGFSFTNSIPSPNTSVPTIDPFFWDGHKMIDIGTLGGTVGFATTLNNKGQVIGFSDLQGDTSNHAFLWAGGSLIDLGTLGGENSGAGWINDSGQVVGTSDLADGTHHAFVWQNRKMIDLGTIGDDPCSNGGHINARGQVIGISTDCNGTILHVFLWERVPWST
jgi:probable HAF family extracellular repeat protein